MYVVETHGSRSTIKIGCLFTDLFCSALGSSSNRYQGIHFPELDLVPMHLRSIAFQHIYYVDSLIGRKTATQLEPRVVLVRDEATRPRYTDYSRYDDDLRYGNSFTPVARILRSWKSDDFPFENDVIHTSISGSITDGSSVQVSRVSQGSPWSLGYFELPGILVDGVASTNMVRCRIRLDTSGISPRLVYVPSEVNLQPKGLDHECLQPLANFIDGSSFTEWKGGFFYKRTYSNASCDDKSISYNVDVEASPTIPYPVGDEYYKHSYRMKYTFLPGSGVAASQNFAVGNYLTTGGSTRSIKMRVVQTAWSRRVGGDWIDYEPEGTHEFIFTGNIHTCILGEPSQETPPVITNFSHHNIFSNGEPISENVFEFMNSSVKNRPLVQSFELFANDLLPDLRTAAHKAAAEAVWTAMDGLDANHIETLSELRDLGKLLEPLKILRSWMSGRFREHDVLKILDDLTSLKLAWSFAIRPTLADSLEIQRKAASLRDKLRNRSYEPVIAYGKFTYDINGEHDIFTAVRFTCHSKVVFSLGRNSVLANLLGFKQAGFYPSLSNFWDLVPLSFVVDWFTNLSKQLTDLDNQVYASCLDVSYCVHSFTLEWLVPGEFLDDNGVAVHTQEVELRSYRREKSRLYPSIRESRFNWNSPPAPRDWGLIGSVFYKLSK